MKNLMEHIAASATGGDSKKPFDEVLDSYSKMGYKKFELYVKGRGSSVEIEKGSGYYIEKAKQYGLTYSSLHLPPIEEDMGESFGFAVKCAFFAEEAGIPVVVFNTTGKGHYVEAMKRLLGSIEGHNITPLVQIHEGRSIDTVEDVLEVLEKVNDPRVMVLHEVGSYHAKGVSWKMVCDTFKDRIGLVHVKDMIGKQSVPLGIGEIDLPALFKEMESLDYNGDFVIEIDPKDRENTNKYIAQAFDYLKNSCGQH